MCTRSDSLARSTRSRCISVTTTHYGNECHTAHTLLRSASMRVVLPGSCTATVATAESLHWYFFSVVYRMFIRQSTQETQPEDSTCTLQWTRQCIRNNLTAK